MKAIGENNYAKNLKKQNIVLITFIILMILSFGAIIFTQAEPGGAIIYLPILFFFLIITFTITFIKKKTNKFLRWGLYLILILLFIGMLLYLLIWILSLSGFDINSFTIDRSSFKFIIFVIIAGFISIAGSLLFPASLILILIGLFSKSDNSKSKKQQPVQTQSQVQTK